MKIRKNKHMNDNGEIMHRINGKKTPNDYLKIIIQQL